jgi:Icc-related predicted phosphoesterase
MTFVGYGDMTIYGTRAGCVELLNTIQKRVKPLYHISGHIHEGILVMNFNLSSNVPCISPTV